MKIKMNLIIECNEDENEFIVYYAKEVLAKCNSIEEVEIFLKDFEEKNKDKSIILRFI